MGRVGVTEVRKIAMNDGRRRTTRFDGQPEGVFCDCCCYYTVLQSLPMESPLMACFPFVWRAKGPTAEEKFGQPRLLLGDIMHSFASICCLFILFPEKSLKCHRR